jgi:plastocyanin
MGARRYIRAIPNQSEENMKPAAVRKLSLAVLAVALAAVFAACGSDSSTAPPATGPFTGTITVNDNFFSPSNVTISVGDSVTWVWKGSHDHSVTSSGGSPFTFDSGIKTTGKFGFRFNSAATGHYFCQIHAGMTGTITVKS